MGDLGETTPRRGFFSRDREPETGSAAYAALTASRGESARSRHLARGMLFSSPRGDVMRFSRLVSPFTMLLVAALAGCQKNEPPKVEQKIETKSTNADGTTSKTTTETKQYGSTLASTTERTE